LGEFPLLVVDPDHGCRTSLAALLRDCGYPVAEARDEVEGIRVARECSPALVILDPWPFVSAAAQMLERIQGLRPGTEVLVLTSETRASMRRLARLSGAALVLEKPCSPADLLAEVNRLLAGRRDVGRA
jgi:DNA-binding response OmpR family regulator